MNLSPDPYVWVAAILTLFVFSFLYRDNPFFCFAEHLLLGLAAGFSCTVYFKNVFLPELIVPFYKNAIAPLWENGIDSLSGNGLGNEFHLFGAVLLCFFWGCKFVRGGENLFRLALAFWVAVSLGLTIPAYIEAKVLAQIAGTLRISLDGSWVEVLGNVILMLGTVSVLTYFFFYKRETPFTAGVSKVGVVVLMVSFGASFSYVILSRVYLLIGRLMFLLRDWLGIVST